jgi:predicted CopG family antitoxin
MPGLAVAEEDSYSSYDNYSSMATYRTINLKPSTYAELVKYKVGGKTFDEILRIFMDRVEPYELDPKFWAEMERELARMKKGDYVTLDELERELRLGRYARKPHATKSRPRNR